MPGIIPEQVCMGRVRRNDWVQGKNQISRSYLEMFRSARFADISLNQWLALRPPDSCRRA